MSGEDALQRLASLLREEETVISPHVVDPRDEPAMGMLTAQGPRATAAPADYAYVVEAIREGYLLHYGRPRIVSAEDPKLRLLAGDYLYALGLDRLAALGDPDAVRVLSDLISACAQAHAERPEADTTELWARALAEVAGVELGAVRAGLAVTLAPEPKQ